MTQKHSKKPIKRGCQKPLCDAQGRSYSPANERIKKSYYLYVKEAKGKSPTTIDNIVKALVRFEEYTQFKDFKTFNAEQATAFKKHLAKVKTEKTKEALSISTLLAVVNPLKDFFRWLAYQPGYRSHIHLPDIEYLNLSDKETRAAKAVEEKAFPTIEQIQRVLQAMPSSNEIELRNRAVVAFLFLTGIRVTALVSIKIKHVELERELVNQNPREVKTKFSKSIKTYFLPVGDEVKQIVVDWVHYLLKEKLYDANAPLFPRTALRHDVNNSFVGSELEPAHWATTTPIRQILKDAFSTAGLPYYNPHSFRNTLTHLGEKICQTPEEFKAWSQNLGHESPLTTFTSYGTLSSQRQGELIKTLKIKGVE